MNFKTVYDKNISKFLANWFRGLLENVYGPPEYYSEILVQTAIFPDYKWFKCKLFLASLKRQSIYILFFILVRKLNDFFLPTSDPRLLIIATPFLPPPPPTHTHTHIHSPLLSCWGNESSSENSKNIEVKRIQLEVFFEVAVL